MRLKSCLYIVYHVIKKVNTFVNGIKVSEEMYYASSKHDTSFFYFLTISVLDQGLYLDIAWMGGCLGAGKSTNLG